MYLGYFRQEKEKLNFKSFVQKIERYEICKSDQRSSHNGSLNQASQYLKPANAFGNNGGQSALL